MNPTRHLILALLLVGPPALAAATSDTARLLQDIPGISLYGAGGVSSLPAIHGLADDRIRKAYLGEH